MNTLGLHCVTTVTIFRFNSSFCYSDESWTGENFRNCIVKVFERKCSSFSRESASIS